MITTSRLPIDMTLQMLAKTTPLVFLLFLAASNPVPAQSGPVVQGHSLLSKGSSELEVLNLGLVGSYLPDWEKAWFGEDLVAIPAVEDLGHGLYVYDERTETIERVDTLRSLLTSLHERIVVQGRRVLYFAEDGELRLYDADRKATNRLGVHGEFMVPAGGFGAFVVSEVEADEDLNGDGDIHEVVLHSADLRTGRVVNHGIQIRPWDRLTLGGDGALLVGVGEPDQGNTDLNGDGDVADGVAHLVNLKTGRIENLGVAIYEALEVGSRWIVFMANEIEEGVDLDGNGYLSSYPRHFFDRQTGKLGQVVFPTYATHQDVIVDGDTAVIFVYELAARVDFDGDGRLGGGTLFFYDAVLDRALDLGIRFIPSGFRDGIVTVESFEPDPFPTTYDVMTGMSTNYGIVGYLKRSLANPTLEVFSEYDPNDFFAPSNLHLLDPLEQTTIDLGFAGGSIGFLGNHFLYLKPDEYGTLEAYDISTGSGTSLGVQLTPNSHRFLPFQGGRAILQVPEIVEDLNGDGQIGADIYHLLRVVDRP